jgi:hypothetical protein
MTGPSSRIGRHRCVNIRGGIAKHCFDRVEDSRLLTPREYWVSNATIRSDAVGGVETLEQRKRCRRACDMRLRALVLVLVTVALLAGPVATQASVVSYDFTVTGTSGPFNGVTSNGNFSFDRSIIPGGGGFVNAAGLLLSLTFSWSAIAYSSATANTGSLQFDAGGNLSSVFFGTNCGNGFCSINSAANQWWLSGGPTTLELTYGSSQDPGFWSGDGSYALAPVVPLPAPGWLLLGGLSGLGFAGWRRTAIAVHGN